MTQNKLTIWLGKKNIVHYGKLSAEAAADTSGNIMQVLIKLIDPNTRHVIGRISATTFSVEDSPQTLLSQESEKFKQLMAGMGAQLIDRGFGGLGLPLKLSGQHIKTAQSAVDRLIP